MALRINTNVTALNAHKNLVMNDTRLSGSIERLSSGLRINRAADDAAGLTISEKLRTQVRGINRAILNVQDGISMIQTAEGALNEVHSMLQRMRELAIQSANDTLTTTDRLEVQKEIQQLKDDINRIAYGTEFNTKKLLDGSGTAAVSTSDPTNLTGVPTGEVLTFSDFSIALNPTVQTLADGTTRYLRGTAPVSRSAIFTRTDGAIASSTTTLQSIANFYDNYGNFILELPENLYLQGDSSQGKLVVSKDISLQELAARIQAAATEDGLGVGLHFTGTEVYFSETGETNGQLVMTSGKRGMIGRINLAGADALVKALSVQEVIPPEDPVFTISSTNIGTTVGTRTTLTTQISGHRAKGLINGIDLIFTQPAEAFVNSEGVELGISIPANFAFDIDDSVTATNTTSATLSAGRWSMGQILSLVNGQISATANAPNVQAFLNANNSLQFRTTDAGSAAYVSISALNVAPNVLGISTGRFAGNDGTSGNAIGSAQHVKFNYTVVETFRVWDSHNAVLNTATVTLAGNYTAGGMTSLVEAINLQLGANPNLFVRAYNNNGRLEFRSLETGIQSNFWISAAATAASLQIGDRFTNTGGGGVVATQDFQSDTTATMNGWPIVDVGGPPPDDLIFFVADLDGRGSNVTISAGTVALGNTFKTIESIVDLVNTATNPTGVKVNAEINTTTDPFSLRLFSTVTGKTGKITLAELSNPASINTLRLTLDLGVGSTQNGVGDYAFTLHVKDQFIQFQIGPNEGHSAKANMIRSDTIALEVNDLDLTTVKDSERAIGLIDQALEYVSAERAKLGAIENRMNYTANSLRVGMENMAASDSRIRDVDMAQEVVELTRFQILQQASNAMLAQANVSGQRILDLLR